MTAGNRQGGTIDSQDGGLLSLKRELHLGRRAKAGCEDALSELIEANAAYVWKVALEYRNLGMSLEDLLGEGNIGLMEAARRYDPLKGCKLVTYAMWWIRKSILGALTKHASILSGSSYHRMKLREIRDTDRKLQGKLGRKPHRAEIDASLREPPGRAEAVLRLHRRVISLDEGSSEHDGLPLAERVNDPNGQNPEDQLIRHEKCSLVQEAVKDLSPMQHQVIVSRFGLEGQDPMTLAELGELMGLSRERIRQVECEGKARLRRWFLRRRAGSFRYGHASLAQRPIREAAASGFIE